MGKAANLAAIGSIADTPLQFRNRIINGDMRIDQRNAGASVTPTNGQFIVDRFKAYLTQASKFTSQQNAGGVTPPSGFRNYLGATSSSAYSVVSSDYFGLVQPIEGFNIADFGWGTASAQTITLSFWVRSSLTGTFGGALASDGSANRSYPFTYTISAANTWEYKTITIAGDTTGAWLSTNGLGIEVRFGLGVGSTWSGTAGAWVTGNLVSATGATSVIGTNGATFYITGVQLERGANQNPVFENRPYGVELAMCQRYYYMIRANTGSGSYTKYGLGFAASATTFVALINFPVTMRRDPTTLDYGTVSWYNVYDGVTNITATGFTIDQFSPNSASVNMNAASGLTQARSGVLQANATTSGYLGFGAEL